MFTLILLLAIRGNCEGGVCKGGPILRNDRPRIVLPREKTKERKVHLLPRNR